MKAEIFTPTNNLPVNLTKEKLYGMGGSLLFCFLLLLVLLFSVLKTVISSEEEGVLVNFGNVDMASGLFEPGGNVVQSDDPVETLPVETPPQVLPQPSVQPQTPPRTSDQPVITQNTEESIAIAEAKKKEEQRRRDELQRQAQVQAEQRRVADEQAAQRRAAETQQRQQQAINNQVAGAFGIGSGNGSQGTGTSGSGNQGSPQGNSDHGANTGIGGNGEFSLQGRSIGSGGLPKPTYTVQEEGRIVVDITVDTKGNVIRADIGKGTNIDNASMRKSALEAAKKAKFNTISGTANQSGTITYRYYLR